MLRTCIILLSVWRAVSILVICADVCIIAKKEDNPEQALKEFRAIVDQEEEKGDW